MVLRCRSWTQRNASTGSWPQSSEAQASTWTSRSLLTTGRLCPPRHTRPTSNGTFCSPANQRSATDFTPFHTAAEENDESDESSEQRAATCVCVWEGWLADTLLYYVYCKQSNGAAGWLQENRWFMRKHRHFRDSTRSDTHLPGF